MNTPFKHKSIMLIDDVDLDNFVSKTIIQAYKFAEEIYIQNSADAAITFLKSLSDNKKLTFPKVIFIDINMPAIDGFQFLQRLTQELKSELAQHKPNLVMLTSSVFNSDRQKARDCFEEITFAIKPLTEETLKTL